MPDVAAMPVPPVSAERLPDLLRAMPKAELHIHIEGSLEPEMMFALAKRNHTRTGYADVESLRAAYDFADLQSFLEIYYAGARVLRTEQDFHDMAWAYLQRAAAEQVLHAEIFFDPQTHTERGVPFHAVIGGLTRACRRARSELGISAELILCFLRHLTEYQALEMLEEALPWRGQFIGVGLDSSERGHPPEKFARVFERCRQLHLHRVAHAGEEGPPEYIRTALDVLKVQRIDHGVQAVHDADLMQRLARERIALTVCPLSNVKLRVFESLSQHNLGRLLDAGLCATVNSDDPSYFGGYINENFVQTFAALGLDSGHAYTLARNSFEAAFMDAAQRARCIDQLNETWSRFA
ncbi:MAG: adenosine deaminase [Betaproteobacteria bacterium]|nr:adenosine deaminase [Betaproteobacteria bacterium]